MQALHFKKIPGAFYRHVFYVGQFYYPIEENELRELARYLESPPEQFLVMITEKLGLNTYLRDAIEKIINEAEDREALARSLQSELRAIAT